ncbi:TcpD family membrane protein [Streptomyces sp. NBC_01408]|uniref:TcpD family membrane protein n=1 Tax=Streptomyces sp. NBC_01408 TaxID=2903855 RepID=UPI002250C7AC|nr:TcpD family membrane protein [Streptomyces sp. NBC_01408]MCX4690948.1 TcpD family membrane protein [Streptomyces sp. NBC_01408]
MLHQTAAETLALTTGADLKGWILAVVGNLFAAFLGVRALGHFLKKEWGEMLTLFVAAVFVAGIVWYPEGVATLLGEVWKKVAGA